MIEITDAAVGVVIGVDGRAAVFPEKAQHGPVAADRAEVQQGKDQGGQAQPWTEKDQPQQRPIDHQKGGQREPSKLARAHHEVVRHGVEGHDAQRASKAHIPRALCPVAQPVNALVEGDQQDKAQGRQAEGFEPGRRAGSGCDPLPEHRREAEYREQVMAPDYPIAPHQVIFLDKGQDAGMLDREQPAKSSRVTQFAGG